MKILSQSTVKHKFECASNQIPAWGLYVARLQPKRSAYTGITTFSASFELQREKVVYLQHILDAAATRYAERTVCKHQIAHRYAATLTPWPVVLPFPITR